MATFDENDPILNKHFAMAGIEPEEKKEGEEEQKDAQTPTGNEQEGSTEDKDSAGTEAQAPKQGEQSKSVGGDKPSGTPDDKGQQGKEKEQEKSLRPGDLRIADGSIVRGGAERRWYENYTTKNNELIMVKNELNQKNQELEKLNNKITEFNTAAQAAGVEDPTDMAAAIRLYKDLAANPSQTLTKLLAEFKAAGHNLDGIGSSVDARIVQQINQKLEQTPQPSVSGAGESDPAIKQEVDSFFAAFPDAKLHESVLAQIVDMTPDIPLVEAYTRLKTRVLEEGLDWTKPIAPQVAARQTQQQQPEPEQQRKPLVNGRVGDMQGAIQQHDPSKIEAQAESFEDAILLGMKDAGLNYTR